MGISNLSHTILHIQRSRLLLYWMINTKVRIGCTGGEGGIRTPGRYKPSMVFKTIAINQTLPPLLKTAMSNYSIKKILLNRIIVGVKATNEYRTIRDIMVILRCVSFEFIKYFYSVKNI